MKKCWPAFIRQSCPLLRAAVVLCLSLSGSAPALTLLWSQGGHASRVSGVACSADGTILASASDDYTVKLWSTNGALLRTLNTAPSPATALAFSPDSTKLAIGTYFGGFAWGNVGGIWGGCWVPGLGLVYLWQAPNGWTNANVSQAWFCTNGFGQVTSLAFSADGLRLVWGNAAGSNYVCSSANASVLAATAGYNTAVGPAAVTSVALSSSGWLVSGCEDKTLRLWNSAWNQVWSTASAHSSNITSVAFSPDGAALVSASLDGTLRLWSTNGTSLRTFTGHASGVTAVAFSPDGAKLASGSLDGSIKLWDRVAGTCLATISAHGAAVTSLGFTPDSKRVLSGGEDALVRLWSAADGTMVQTLGAQRDYIGTAAISPDGALCASAGGGSSIFVRRAIDGALLLTLAGHSNFVSALAFGPDSATLASGGGPLDSTIKLWRLSDGALVRTITAGTNGVTALAFSLDGDFLASGGDCTEQAISLWSVASGALARAWAGHSNGVTALAFSPRGGLLASGGRRFDNAVKVWAVTNDAPVRTLSGHSNNIESVAFAPDGNSLVSGSSGPNNLRLWQLADGSSRTFGTGTNPVFAVGFSPDGTTLASADRDTINFWSVASGSLSETVTQSTFRVSCFGYSPNGNLFVWGREDATVALATNSRGALGQPRLAFASAAAPSAGVAGFSASVQPWAHYIIQSSTNLLAWSFLTQAISASNSLSLSIPVTNGPAGFVRALTPP
jgi:WD40 repeat protein